MCTVCGLFMTSVLGMVVVVGVLWLQGGGGIDDTIMDCVVIGTGGWGWTFDD